MLRLLGLGGRPEHHVEGRRVVEEQPLSEGGFSFVVLCRDCATSERLALKKILCQDSEQLRDARHEIEVLAQLPTHPHLCAFLGASLAPRAAGQEALLLLELCDGHLLRLLERHAPRPAPEPEVLRAAREIAEGLFCLHAQRLAHRDLKLENVLLGRDGCWKLCDFGSCTSETWELQGLSARRLRELEEELGRRTTPMYRPPEVVDVYLRLPVGLPVDLWMLGCILFVLLFNVHPFQDGSALAIRNAKYRVPESGRSRKLQELLVWLLMVDPRQRPSARKLVGQLWTWEEPLSLPQAVVEKLQTALPRNDWVAFAEPQSVQDFLAAGGGVRAACPVAVPAPSDDDDWAFEAFQSAESQMAAAALEVEQRHAARTAGDTVCMSTDRGAQLVLPLHQAAVRTSKSEGSLELGSGNGADHLISVGLAEAEPDMDFRAFQGA